MKTKYDIYLQSFRKVDKSGELAEVIAKKQFNCFMKSAICSRAGELNNNIWREKIAVRRNFI